MNAITHRWKLVQAGVFPPPRKAGKIVYDQARQVAVLFGGGSFNDTWLWDGTTWKQSHPAIVPPARTNAAMTYDPVRKRILLFGGVNIKGQPLNDTWLWDGTTWRQMHPVSAPEPRVGACLVFDEARQQSFLFGGTAFHGRVGTLLHDTWLWDGITWKQPSMETQPEERTGACMAYDAKQHAIVLFGGSSRRGVLNDTWLWDGHQWILQQPATQPSPRAWACMAFHQQLQQVFLVGGAGTQPDQRPINLNDTWAWDGKDWRCLDASAQFSGGHHAMTYDTTHQTMLLYTMEGSKADRGTKRHPIAQPPATPPKLLSATYIWT